MSSLLILGAGQYSRIVYEIALENGVYDKISFLDDTNENAIGKLRDAGKFTGEYTDAVVAMGNCELRLKLLEELEELGYNIPVIISPLSHVSPSAKIGKGTVIEPMAVVNPNAVIGKGCLICAGAIINHDSIVGDSCHINCNAVINSNAALKKFSRLNCCCVLNRE